MLIDSRKLWEDGGYSKDNDFDVSINRVRKYAKDRKYNGAELILTDFFIELSADPYKYLRTEGVEVFGEAGEHIEIKTYYTCDCGCEIGNSGTNAIHEIFKRIDEAVKKETEIENDIYEKKLNKLIVAHMESDNKKYTEEHGPKKYKWHDMPTFKKILRIK